MSVIISEENVRLASSCHGVRQLYISSRSSEQTTATYGSLSSSPRRHHRLLYLVQKRHHLSFNGDRRVAYVQALRGLSGGCTSSGLWVSGRRRCSVFFPSAQRQWSKHARFELLDRRKTKTKLGRARGWRQARRPIRSPGREENAC
jgi:hypothetical protein